MGSLENGIPLKRDNNTQFLRSSRLKSARWILFKRIHYLHWISAVAVFFFFVFFLQMLLPGSGGSDKSGVPWISNDGDSMFWDKIGEMDFGEDIKFDQSFRLLGKFQKESIIELNSSSLLRRGVRFGNRKPLLALIFGDLHIDSQQILMSTVSVALLEIGYEIEVYALEDGPAYSVLEKVGVRVNLIGTQSSMSQAIDWLKYDGVIVTSVGAMEVFSSLLQEPFKNVPLVWTIHDSILADYLKTCVSNNQVDIINNWKRFFNRATVIVFPNYALPMFYSAFDAGNYFVIPGSPAEAWEADTILASYINDNPRAEMGYGSDDFIIVIVGSKFLYKGLWLEHALILKALSQFSTDLSSDKSSNAQVKIVILAGDSSSNYSMAVEAIALNLQFPRDSVKHVPDHEDSDRFLNLANLVVYGSFLEEQSFPEILVKAMNLEKPIIAPDLPMISKYVHDRVNGYLFPKDDINSLTRILREVILNGKLSPLARNIASVSRQAAKNFMVSETIEGYAFLMEKILELPSEVSACRPSSDIPVKLKDEWQWHLFESSADTKTHLKTTIRSTKFLEKIDGQWNRTRAEGVSRVQVPPLNEMVLRSIWEEEKHVEVANNKKRREDEELKDRTDQPRGTWDEVYRSVKRADRTKNDLHEREDGELERTGQPLCIYEPFIGEGTWPFLHRSSLYRGIGLSTRGRRPGGDDIDAPSRLPLLNNPYYRDALGDYGAFLAIANRVDHIHRNAWIGFQSWRATAKKESLSKGAETALLDAINGRKHGDTLYFWAGLDKDPRNRLQQDFWSFCDAINAGNCKFAFLEALKRMYGIKSTNFTSLPSMPADGGTWSVMHSWVLPTKSFMEFVMFSRMFVDALETQIYNGQQQQHNHCYLNIQKDKHCYSRVLELLVNVWAYHSGRHMLYVNPNTGEMQEQHTLKNRSSRGEMWVKWFAYTTLKSMDEDLAEEAAESDRPSSGWLWPSTGEVFWQGMYEKERNEKNIEKEKKKKQNKDKLDRMRKKHHQKTIGGKYPKPPLTEDKDIDFNSTTVLAGGI